MKQTIRFSLMALALLGGSAFAADHIDSPTAVATPAADITDIYAWMNADKTKINMIINVHPNADTNSRFSDAVKYIFHVTPHGDATAALTNYTTGTYNLACKFNSDQLVTCELGDTKVIDEKNASGTDGVSSDDGSVKVFAGLRDDPFFMAFTEFTNTTKAVKDAVSASALTFNDANCPDIDGTQTYTDLRTALTSGTTNTFAGQNVLSLVIQADISLFGTGPLYNVSASTRRI